VDSKNDFGRPKSRWRDDVENDIRKTGVAKSRQVAQDRDNWRKAPREPLILFLDSAATTEEKKKMMIVWPFTKFVKNTSESQYWSLPCDKVLQTHTLWQQRCYT
jgi:hypothetical protein